MVAVEMAVKKIKVGDIYEDCSYHPVWCTVANASDVEGVSLFDGSKPRSCSIRHCGVRKMTAKQVALRIKRRDEWLKGLGIFKDAWYSEEAGEIFRKLMEEEAGLDAGVDGGD